MTTKNVFGTKEFLKLRWEWYKKLSDEGFKDCEFHMRRTGESLPVLNGMSVTDIERMQTRWGGSKVEYYRLAEHHLRHIERKYGKKSWQWKAWRTHADGFGTRTIAKQLNMALGDIIRYINTEKRKIHKKQQQDDVTGYV